VKVKNKVGSIQTSVSGNFFVLLEKRINHVVSLW